MKNVGHYPEQFIIESDRSIHLTFTPAARRGRRKLTHVGYHPVSPTELPSLFTLFSLFTIIKLERKTQLENCAFSVPLSSCNKYEKYMCHGQMAGRQNTHSKWRTVFHTTQTKSKQQSRANKNKITLPISIPDRELTGREAGKGTRMKWLLVLHPS